MKHRPFSIAAATLLVATLFLSLPAPLVRAQTVPAPSATPAWQDSGLKLPAKYSSYCLDGQRPDRLLVSVRSLGDLPVGTYEYNLKSGQSSLLSDRAFSLCLPSNGLMFDITRGVEGAVRFSRAEPQGQPIKYAPTEVAADGSLRVYALSARRLFASRDAGTNWQEIGLPFQGRIEAITISEADSRAIYLLTRDRPAKGEYLYTLQSSVDGGQTWEQHNSYRLPETSSLDIRAGLGPAAPVNNLMVFITGQGSGTYDSRTLLSGDGGRTFHETGQSDRPYDAASQQGQYFFVTSGVVRFTNRYSNRLALEISGDAGQTWQPTGLPALENGGEPGKLMVLQQSAYRPDNLWLSNSDGTGSVWFSVDAGRHWTKTVANMTDLLVKPAAPGGLVGIKSKKLYSLEWPEADRAATAPALPLGMPGSLYFPETLHNLSPLFQAYWQQQGGLAQFGFPRTEAFRELNLSDSQIYTVQYFERNRFEYHPENSGTPYEVQLGLLGNSLTAGRKNEPAFRRAERQAAPGTVYFAETGHNLGLGFKTYWEIHGGLSLFGFPVSEEFEELNPDDGKTYTVQYFERNRFEYHPEQRGTPYEVLLGLLGNTVLNGKGWDRVVQSATAT